MIYYGAKELAASSRTVRKNTLIIAQEIPENQYGFKPVPEYRSVAQLLSHIALSYQFQYQFHGADRGKSLEGFDFPSLMKRLMAEEAEPRTKAQVISLLEKEGEVWAGFEEGLSEEASGAQPPRKPSRTTNPAKTLSMVCPAIMLANRRIERLTGRER